MHLGVPFWSSPIANQRAHANAQFEQLLSNAIESDLVSNAIIAENLHKAKHLWHIRESITSAQAMEGLNIKNDISLPVSSIPEFVESTRPSTEGFGARRSTGELWAFGDGNLHYNVQAPKEMKSEEFLTQFEEQVNALVYQQVQRFRGSISAEHGIGSLKVNTLPKYKDPWL
jgi:FAD/FMN-containing dehydrogenase